MQKIVLSIAVFIVLIAEFLHPIRALTQDLGRHIKTGQIIVAIQSVPKINLYSYTYPDFPFINHHWLSEVIFYFIYQLTSFNGLLIFILLIVTLAFSLVFFFSLKRAGIIPTTIVAILMLGVLFERTDVRPEIFSFLFLSAFVTILYRNREKLTKWIFFLPFLELIWINTHIYFPIGIAVIGLFFIDGLLLHRKKLTHQYIHSLGFVLVASILTTLINPSGISGALYPFRALSSYGYSIEENQNIFFLLDYFQWQKSTILFFLFSGIASLSSLILAIRKTRPIDWLLVAFFIVLGIVMERNFPLFVFGAFIPFATSLSTIIQKPLTKNARLLVVLVLLALLALQFAWVANQKPLGQGTEKGAQAAVDFFIKQRLKGPIFNNFDIGSYLDFRLFPKEKVFIDGRPEAYPVSFFKKEYIPMQQNPKVFEQMDKKYNLNAIFFSHADMTPWGRIFLKTIVTNPNWQTVYLDEFVIILVKKNEQNKPILEKFNVTNGSFRTDFGKISDTQILLRYANFFQLVSWKKQEIPLYQAILTKDPNNCAILFYISRAFFAEKNPAYTIYEKKYQDHCQ